MDTIKSSAEISSLFTYGKRFHTSYLTLIVLSTRGCPDSGGRVAFIAGKKLGNAVWRNAAKRRMRALCREFDGPWTGLDVIFLAKSPIKDVPYGDLCSSFGRALRKIQRFQMEGHES